MGEVAVRVENIGKKYLIGHQVASSIGDRIRGAFQKSSQKQLEEFWALKDVTFDINKGEAVGIIGNNGAGKSTLLKILSRITHPTEGRLEMNGRVSSLLEVGTGFHPELSGRENIFLNGTILGMSRQEIKSKFDEIVEFSGVSKFIDTPVKHYSSGMYVRLAFSVAAHLEPEILIIDEVLAVGDAEFQKKCLGKMDEVTSQGRTVLFVSHNLNAVKKLCNRGVLIRLGKVELITKDINYALSKFQGSLSEAGVVNHIIASKAEFDHIFIDGYQIEKQNFSYNEEIVAVLQGRVLEPDEELNIGMKVYNSDELLLLSVNSKDSDITFNEKFRFTLNFRIPERLLNAGNYSIEFVSDIRYKAFVVKPGDLSRLSFQIQGGFPWSLQKPSLLVPEVPVKLEKLLE